MNCFPLGLFGVFFFSELDLTFRKRSFQLFRTKSFGGFQEEKRWMGVKG